MSAKLFNFEGNYKQVLDEYTTLIEKSAGKTPRDFRMHIIEKMTDAYVEQTGKRPDPKFLERLTNVVLHEELTDPRPDKMTIEEYPIMSDNQYGRRTTGSQRAKNTSGVVSYEVPIERGANLATDGIDYTPHTRTFNNPF